MAFRVGQKVTQKTSEPWTFYAPDVALGVVDPEYGKIYTIRDVIDYQDGEEPGLRFNEIVNPPGEYSEGKAETTFCASRFRPVVEKSTDTGMAILREILDRETHDERTPAPVR